MKRKGKDYDALLPRFVELVHLEYKNKDIAQELGISLETVSVWKQRHGLSRPKAPSGQGVKHSKAGQEDTPATIDMCLHCEQPRCFGWCYKVAHENDK